MKLYHGSNLEIEEIDLAKCKPYKDFGKGFYVTSIKKQAIEMAKNTSKLYGGVPIVTVYDFQEELLESDELNTKCFPMRPTVEWAIFINNNRNREFLQFKSF